MAEKNTRRDKDMDVLFKAILSLETLDECYDFFEDLCTMKELADMVQRVEAAKMLLSLSQVFGEQFPSDIGLRRLGQFARGRFQLREVTQPCEKRRPLRAPPARKFDQRLLEQIDAGARARRQPDRARRSPGGHPGDEVDLVEDLQARHVCGDVGNLFPRFSVRSSGCVQHRQHDVRSLDLAPRARNAFALDGVVRVSQPGRVRHHKRDPADDDVLAQDVAGRARRIRDDRPVVARKAIEQA